MEYTLDAFVSKFKDYFVLSPLFPYYYDETTFKLLHGLSTQSDASKHKDRMPTHLKDETVKCFAKSTVFGDNITIFDLGNEEMKRDYPHYHILEDAPVIRKRGKGTLKTKGTQDMIKETSKRDYGYVYWNGKTFTKEYSRNVRGSRKRTESVSHWGIVDGKAQWINRDSNSYQNVHYHYIENILDMDILDKLALEFNMKRARTVKTGLEEEFATQEGVSVESILETFGSFM